MRSPGKRTAKEPAADPGWLRPVVFALTALFLIGLFSPAVSDTDFWWHLKTGDYIVEAHRLPVPDPFAWTTAKVPPTSPAEAETRRFNLTHEWLAQVLMFLVWRVGGFAGVVAARAVCMTLVCGIVAAVCARRSGSWLGGVAGGLACSWALAGFAFDRPYQVTFLCLALTIAAMEFRRWMWSLPIVFLIWANCHGGFFLGLVVLGAYCAEGVWRRSGDRRLWLTTAACLAASAINPNGLAVFVTVLRYQSSYMQGRLLEWARPSVWPPSAFSVLLAGALVLMVIGRRRVRPADWMLWLAFTAASLSALRNTPFVGIAAPVWMAGVWPWRRPLPGIVRTLAPAALAAAVVGLPMVGGSLQFRDAGWNFPAGAAGFLKEHRITAPLFNTYEYGGYLIWRLAPQQRVFIDGRALSDKLFLDYARILYNHDNNDGMPSGEELLDRYGVGAIVMNTFEPATGAVYVLAPALADPAQKTWKLVYRDAQAVVFVRNPPDGVAPLPSLQVLDHMEDECALHLANEPQYPRCARSLGDVFLKAGDRQRARRWLATYLEKSRQSDPEAERALQQLLAQ